MQAARIAAGDLRQLLVRDLFGLGAEVGQLGLQLLGPVDTHAGALLRPALREDQLAAVLQAKPESRRLWALRSRLEEADASGAHQVDVQDELAVVGGED